MKKERKLEEGVNNVQKESNIHTQIISLTYGWICGPRVGGWLVGWVDRWMDRQMER